MTIDAPPNRLQANPVDRKTVKLAAKNTNFSVFRLWQLISPALPVGAYAYSQGMEFAVHHGDIDSPQSAQTWISGLLQHSYCYLDLALFRRLYQSVATADPISFMHWNATLLSYRESRELLAEDLQMGAALMRLLVDLELNIPFHSEEISFAAAFAQASHACSIDEKTAAQGLAFAWCENQVACAIKLIPLGQTDGQRLLYQLSEQIASTVEKAWQLTDQELGYTSQGLATYSALHEQQYTRLFRS